MVNLPNCQYKQVAPGGGLNHAIDYIFKPILSRYNIGHRLALRYGSQIALYGGNGILIISPFPKFLRLAPSVGMIQVQQVMGDFGFGNIGQMAVGQLHAYTIPYRPG